MKKKNNTEKLNKILIDIVNERGPIKGTFLVSEFFIYVHDHALNIGEYDLLENLNTLVKENKIGEIEYVHPSANYRVKSLYCSIGVKVKVVNLPEL